MDMNIVYVGIGKSINIVNNVCLAVGGGVCSIGDIMRGEGAFFWGFVVGDGVDC